jgi:hypothetical protein
MKTLLVTLYMLSSLIAHAEDASEHSITQNQNRFYIQSNAEIEFMNVYKIDGDAIDTQKLYDPTTRILDTNLLPAGTYLVHIKANNPEQEIITRVLILNPGKGTEGLSVKGKYYNYWVSLKSPETQQARWDRFLQSTETEIRKVFDKNGCVVHSLNLNMYTTQPNDAYRYSVFMDWNATCNTIDHLKVELELPAWFFSSAYVIIQPYLKGQLTDYLKIQIE